MPEPVSCPASTADDRAMRDGKAGVQFRLQLVVVNASGHEHVQEVARIERDEVVMETVPTGNSELLEIMGPMGDDSTLRPLFEC
jgi:uncharacterized protein (UPF0212 family)